MRPKFKQIIAALTGLMMTAGILAGTAQPAAANINVTASAEGYVYNLSTDDTWWTGGWKTTAGLAFCMQPTKDSSTSVALANPAPLTKFYTDQAVYLSNDQLNQLAYLMWKAAKTGLSVDDEDGQTMYNLVMLTIMNYNYTRVYSSSGTDKLSIKHFDLTLNTGAQGATLANSLGLGTKAKNLLQEARDYATNWDGSGTLDLAGQPTIGGVAKSTVTLPGIGTGAAVIFTVKLPDGTTKTFTQYTVDDVATLSYNVTKYGSYQITAKTSDTQIPPRYPMAAINTSSSMQSLLMVSGVDRSWASPNTLQFSLSAPQPTISTQISATQVGPGDRLSDSVTLGNVDRSGYSTYKIEGQLLGLPATVPCPGQGAAAWSSARPLATISLQPAVNLATPDGSLTVSNLGGWTVPDDTEPMCVTYQETVTQTVDGQSPVVVSHPAGHPNQTARVVLPIKPVIEVIPPTEEVVPPVPPVDVPEEPIVPAYEPIVPAEEPTTEEPTTDQPTTDQPTTEKPMITPPPTTHVPIVPIITTTSPPREKDHRQTPKPQPSKTVPPTSQPIAITGGAVPPGPMNGLALLLGCITIGIITGGGVSLSLRARKMSLGVRGRRITARA